LREYYRPSSLEQALSRLAGGGWTVVAGCTDSYCRPDALPDAADVLDLTGLSEARGMTDADDVVRIGALTTWSELAAARLPAQFDALREAARQIGGVQIQNAGSLGGNLCNASPAADGVPPLLILDASVELRSRAGARVMPLHAFIVGNRRTTLRPDELLTAILVPKRQGRHASLFHKLGARAYQVISIVMVAALLEADGLGRIASAAVAVGSCSPVARRLPALEDALIGRDLAGPPLSGLVAEAHLAPLAPLSDVRGTAAYRMDAARLLVGRALDELQARLR
jgi:CO/xanthine dehydrogenase FAD-binding subunit